MHVAEVSDTREARDTSLAEKLAPALDDFRITPPVVAVYQIGAMPARRAIAAFLAP